MMAATEDLLVDRDGPILTVTFNRPAQRNAMTLEALLDAGYTAADVDALVASGAAREAET